MRLDLVAEGVLGMAPRDEPLMHKGRRGLYSLIRPQEGWLSLVLLLANLLVVVWTVERADWADTPSLGFVVFLGVVTGLLFAKLRLHALLLHPLALSVGFVTAVWQMAALVERDSGAARLEELWFRMGLWIEAAGSGGISIDTIPFALILVSLSWLIGYLAAWALFRYHNFWLAILPGGAGILTNLAYLPSHFVSYFFLYLFTAFLLLVRIQTLRREDTWRRRRVDIPDLLWLYTLNDGLWFTLLILIVAFLLPVGRAHGALESSYEFFRSPVEHFRSDFNRLFAALPARKPLPNRSFGAVLPFQGTISLAPNPVLEVESPVPMYWRARSYSVYTSKGWMMGHVQRYPGDWLPSFWQEESYERRFEVKHKVTLNLSTATLFTGAEVVRVSSQVQVETYDSPVYTLDLRRPSADRGLPEDVRRLAQALREDRQGLRAGLGPALLVDRLPQDLALLDAEYGGGYVTALRVARKLPHPPDILAVHSTQRLYPSDTYEVTSSVSYATAEELREAGEDYPGWVLDRYLQLPSTLPQRVRDLAHGITGEARTPYDKAEAIIAYLGTFPYTLHIDPPPYDGDGVDHFLFTLGRGYSDYFASAATVLLRAVGVPTRLAAGYAPGEKGDGDFYVVRDSDSHAWPEVFFPGYGWVPLEATPGREAPGRVEPPEAVAVPLWEFEEEEFEDDEAGGDSGPLTFAVAEESWKERLLGTLPWLSIPLALALAFWYLWRRFMTPPLSAEAAFQRLALMGALGGVGPRLAQTPYQYGDTLRGSFPSLKDQVRVIVEAYVKSRYGRKLLSPEEQARLRRAWRALRGRLVLRMVRRR